MNPDTRNYSPDLTAPVASFNKKTIAVCVGCGEAICDPMYASVENVTWHVTCMKCCVCSVVLGGENSCYKKNGRIYCRDDYIRCFRSCATCRIVIQPPERVMRVRDLVYHAGGQCFCCSKCKRPLVPGDKYVALPEAINCWDCCRVDSLDDASSLHSGSPNKPGRPRKRKQSSLPSPKSMTSLQLNLRFGNDELNSAHERSQYGQKSKRIRTSFKHNQLCVMKAYFDSNHNPDAKDLKQLSQETGLTKRVLQVWFQNARAKYRRSCQQNRCKVDTEPCLESKSSNSVTSPSSDGGSPSSETGSDDSKTFSHEAEDIVLLPPFHDYNKSYMDEAVSSCSASGFDCSLSPLTHFSTCSMTS